MKLQELHEAQETKKLSQAAFDALSEPNAKNIKDRYKVGAVAFDNAKGLGAVPNNQEVDYLGFAVELSPADFLRLAAHKDRGEDAEKIEELIRSKAPIGAPFLNVKVDLKAFRDGGPLEVEIVGHEGRGRMQAAHAVNGEEKIPVHVFVKGNVRAHDLDEKFFKSFREIKMAPEGVKVAPIKAHFGKIFWMGKTL